MDMLLAFVYVIIQYIVCVFLKNYLCVCVFVCAPTGLKGGALCRHAPCAGAAASGPHDRELVQCIGLQTCHHVVQAGGVSHLQRERQTESHFIFHTSSFSFLHTDYFYPTFMC